MKMVTWRLGFGRRLAVALAYSALMLCARNSASAQVVAIGSASGSPGETVSFDVTLSEGNGNVAIVVNDIGIDGLPFGVLGNGRPDCTLNPAITKPNTAFSFLPRNCAVGTTCTTVRGAVISLDPNTARDPIADGVLYTCRFPIPGEATVGTTYELPSLAVTVTTPDAVDIVVTDQSTGGQITVAAASPTPTATNTPAPPTVTNTPSQPTSTPTNTAKPTSGGGSNDDDGCQMVAPAAANSGWLLLLPAALLIWRRRRTR
jgi:hypothetical protein